MNRAEHVLRRDLVEIPGPDRRLHRLQQRVLADPLRAAEDQRVIDLLGGRCTRCASQRRMWSASSPKTLRTWSSQGSASAALPGSIAGGRYKLKHRQPAPLDPATLRDQRSQITSGSPGAQVICSTGRC